MILIFSLFFLRVILRFGSVTVIFESAHWKNLEMALGENSKNLAFDFDKKGGVDRKIRRAKKSLSGSSKSVIVTEKSTIISHRVRPILKM